MTHFIWSLCSVVLAWPECVFVHNLEWVTAAFPCFTDNSATYLHGAQPCIGSCQVFVVARHHAQYKAMVGYSALRLISRAGLL